MAVRIDRSEIGIQKSAGRRGQGAEIGGGKAGGRRQTAEEIQPRSLSHISTFPHPHRPPLAHSRSADGSAEVTERAHGGSPLPHFPPLPNYEFSALDITLITDRFRRSPKFLAVD
jgi:hypothetical protein